MSFFRIGPFIENRLKNRSLRTQILATVLAGFAFAFDIGSIYFVLEGESRITYGGATIVLALMYVLVPLLLWLLFTTAFYAIIAVFGARSEFAVLFRGTGWGMIPFVGAASALSLGRYLGVRSAEPCEFSAMTCEAGTVVPLLEQVEALFGFAHTVSTAQAFQLGFGVFTLFFLVSAVLWGVSVEKSSNLTRLGVLVTVGLPCVVFYAMFAMITF